VTRTAGAKVERAGEALHGLDDRRPAVLESTAAFSAATSLRGTNCTSNGVRGKPYHDSFAPQVTAEAAAVRPWKLCSIADDLRAPGEPEREPERVLVRLGAAVDEEHLVRARAGRRPRALRRPSSRTLSGSAFVWNTSSRLARASVSLKSRWP
jgi:hypothetical protein